MQARPPPADERVRARLKLGAATAAELTAALGISQPTLSRAVRALGSDVLVRGRARATRYALRRALEDLGAVVPVFEIGRAGEPSRHVADLHLVEPGAFWVEGRVADVPSGEHADLPWFLHDLRPSGYLGREVPHRHPELGLPPDVRLWSSDHVLRWLARYGWDGVGAFVVGREAFERLLDAAEAPSTAVPADERARAWPERARDTLGRAPAGSSAGGEEPKFLATRRDPDGEVPVLVKFSPPVDSAVGRRRGDLLVAEHLALRTLHDHGRAAARSQVLLAEERVFLEVERFDRQGAGGRVGQVSLEALDAELVGRLGTWTEATEALLAQGLLTEGDHREVRWLQAFGRLIANTDQHLANLSVRLRGARPDGIAPAYDMLPMLCAPVAGEVVPRSFAPARPRVEDADLAPEVVAAAADLWARVAADGRISEGFRAIAAENRARVEALAERVARLPR